MLDSVEFRNSGPRLSGEDFAAFEREIGGQLPEDYKRFLLKQNGGMMKPELGLRWGGEVNVIPYLGAIEPDLDCYSWRALQSLREFGVDGFLPICSTRNGEDICLDFRKSIGAVWLAEFQRKDDRPVSVSMHPLAESFTDFVNSLLVIPEIYCPIAELGERGTPDDLERYLREGNDLNAISKNGFSILCEAIKFRNRPMADACIERGASLYKSLHVATYTQQPDLIKRLVAAGADVNERDEHGRKPIDEVLGTSLPGPEGALNRDTERVLLGLGAKK